MPFLTGRMTAARFRVSGAKPRLFAPEDLELLAAHAIGTQKVASADGSQSGWTAGDHVLDTTFDLEKNIVNDTLNWHLRIDTNKLPADRLRAYYAVELKALAANNPSGHPSARQKREARAVARDRLEQEARDGRFIKHKLVDIQWDLLSNELRVSANGAAVLDRLYVLFKETFDRTFSPLNATAVARHFDNNGADAADPTIFVHGQKDEVAWIKDDRDVGFLGNEFLLWLWFRLENESDTVKLADESEVTLMIARTLSLDCPRGQYGRETFSTDGPAKLPEAFRALQAGRLPRKVGLTMVRHDKMYELTLQAESLAIGSAKLPPPEGENDRAVREERVDQVRHLLETVDSLFQAFLEIRLGAAWVTEAAKIKRWLKAAVAEEVG